MSVPFYVVACSGEKANHECPAAELYQGQLFKMNLAAALRAAGSASFVRILSAKHGILRLDDVIEPYDCSWSSPDAISANNLAATCVRFIDHDVYLLGPAEYLKKLDEASVALAAIDDECEPHPSVKAFLTHHVAEGNAGVGDQRKTARIVRETAGMKVEPFASCPDPPTTLSQIAENVIAFDPFAADVIQQEQFSAPGLRINSPQLRELLQAAFNLGYQQASTDCY